MNCLNCGHPESDHETVEYRGDKARSCVRHLNDPSQPRCRCRRFRSQPTREEVLESALRSLRNECAGLLGAFGDEIAPIVGHTNLTVLQHWIANADSVLPPPK